jgi:hypothetical protein
MGKKADKMLGGNKVMPPRTEWKVELTTDLDEKGSALGRITITGTSPDSVSAALDASRARLELSDTLKADGAVREATHGNENGGNGGKTDKARR